MPWVADGSFSFSNVGYYIRHPAACPVELADDFRHHYTVL